MQVRESKHASFSYAQVDAFNHRCNSEMITRFFFHPGWSGFLDDRIPFPSAPATSTREILSHRSRTEMVKLKKRMRLQRNQAYVVQSFLFRKDKTNDLSYDLFGRFDSISMSKIHTKKFLSRPNSLVIRNSFFFAKGHHGRQSLGQSLDILFYL
jgi:hypothetical protein